MATDAIVALEHKLHIMHANVCDLKTMVRRYHNKMMEGFKAIEKSFKLNCKAQMQMSEQIEDFTGELTHENVLRV